MEETMRKSLSSAGIMILSLIFVGSLALYGNSSTSEETCCIEGTYKGAYKDTPSPSCNEPGSGEFIMSIYQEEKCGSKIWGKIVDTAGAVMEFNGTVTPGAGGCCNIAGKTTGSGDTIQFKAVLCRSGKKWLAKSGAYVNSNGCKGTFKLAQQ